MAEKIQELRCSFCGKSQDEVKKLVAGPKVYICNECVSICDEIMDEADRQQVAASAKAGRLLARARTDLKAARLLIDAGYYRVAIVAARSCAAAALELLGARPSMHSPYGGEFAALYRQALNTHEELRRLDGLAGWRLLIEYAFDDEVGVAQATQAVDTADDIISYIGVSLDAT